MRRLGVRPPKRAHDAIAEAAVQYGQAIVKFPDNKGWVDLLDRVTSGAEDWKTLAAIKNKKGLRW